MTYNDKLTAFSRMSQNALSIVVGFCENTFGSAVPPSTCTSTAATKCYKTLITCSDPDNFRHVNGKSYNFCMAKKLLPFPGEVWLPFLIKPPQYRATEIDPNKSLTKNAKITYTLLNPDSNDIGIDPHVSDRATYPGNVGPFWDLFFERNPYYRGRFIHDYSGFQGLTLNQYISRRFMMEKVSFNADGTCNITCKDILKNASKVDVPTATDGLTTGVTTAGAATINMTAGTDMTQYTTAGFIHAGDEGENIIQYTGKAAQSFTGCTWQKFGTAQANIDDETGVQQCFVKQTTWVDTVMIDILEDFVGIASGDINSAEFESERDLWLGGYIFDICWVKPVKASERLRSLQEQSGTNVWWDEETEKVRLKAFAPVPPGGSYKALTEANNIKNISVVDYNDDSRISRVIVYSQPINNTLDLQDPISYVQAYGDISATSEGANQYGIKAVKEIFADGAPSSVAASIASRLKRRFVNPPRKYVIEVERKDADIDTAEIITLTHRRNIHVDGTQKAGELFQVLKRQVTKKGTYNLTVLDTKWALRYGFICPSGYPDYDGATDDQKQRCFIGAAGTNLVGAAGESGYYMF